MRVYVIGVKKEQSDQVALAAKHTRCFGAAAGRGWHGGPVVTDDALAGDAVGAAEPRGTPEHDVEQPDDPAGAARPVLEVVVVKKNSYVTRACEAQLMESNVEFAQLLNNPQLLRESLQMAANPVRCCCSPPHKLRSSRAIR